MRFVQVFLTVAFLVTTGVAQATPQPQDSTALDVSIRATIDRDVADVMKSAHVAGSSIALLEHGRIVYERGYGLRDEERTLPADDGTRYEIGSITKQFAAIAVLQLREARKLKLDVPLSTYVPDVPHAKDVTIRQLLAQTSGLPEYINAPNIETLVGKPVTFDALMARIADKPLDFTPGTRWEYSSTNYVILGRVIEIVSGQTWEAYAKDHLFSPAGMDATSTIADEAQQPDMARGYAIAKGHLSPSPPVSETWATSAGGIVSTVGDLAKWSAALAAGRIVSPADNRLVSTPQTLADGSRTAYGFGFYVDIFDEQPRIWHNGNTFGFDGSDQYFPKQDLRIIVLTNLADGHSDEIVARIFGDLYPAIAANARNGAAGTDPGLAKQFAIHPQSIAPEMSAEDIYRRAVTTMRSVNAPAYLQYKFHVITTYHGKAVEQNFIQVERTEDRNDKIRSTDYDPNRKWRAFEIAPDLFLGHASGSTPAPTAGSFYVGLDTSDQPLKTIGRVVQSQLSYTVSLAGTDDLANCEAAIHLRLTPVSNPLVYNLRDLWVDPATARICRASAVYRAQLDLAFPLASITLDLNSGGLIERYSTLITAHLLVGTDRAQQDAVYRNIRSVDKSVWETSSADP